MKKALIILAIISISIYGCNQIDKTSKIKNIQTDVKKYDSIVKSSETKKINLEYDKKFKEIFNQKLIGLTIKKKKETNDNKRYWVDFSAACMCNSPSIYIDEKFKKLIIFNYCDNGTPPNDLEQSFEYIIYKIENDETSISIHSKNKNDINLVLKFNKISNSQIYRLQIMGRFPDSYVGSKLNEYFITKSNIYNFEIEDCGDFDG